MTELATPATVLTRYQRAAELIKPRIDWNNKVMYNTTVSPYWIEDSTCFWYERASVDAIEYRLVDANKGSNIPAFDQAALAQALAEQSGEAVDANNLPLQHLVMTNQAKNLSFTAFDQHWHYDTQSSTLTPKAGHLDHWAISPDGQWAAFSRDHNLWLRKLNTGEEMPLTHDGEACYEYAGVPTVYGRQEFSSLELRWSPDSSRIFTLLTDKRQVSTRVPLVQHVPPGDDIKPVIVDADLRTGLVGDEYIETYTFLAIDIRTGHIQPADYRPCPTFYPPYIGFFSSVRGWWSDDSRHAYFVDLSRDGQQGRLVECDTHTGQCRVLIEEQDAVYITLIPTTHTHTLIHTLPDSNELIWFSERSGWGHLYLYDLSSGRLKNPITEGQWLVTAILHVDPERRELWIKTAGRIEGRNPYYSDICRVNIDTGELTVVRSSDHDYVVRDGRAKTGKGLPDTGVDKGNGRGVSPCGNYVITTRSRVDEMPVSLLLDRNGQTISTLETGSVTHLPEHGQWPEPVMLKAADGETDIYSVVFRPSDFSPEKSYPVLDASASDNLPVGSFTNGGAMGTFYAAGAAYAELGFIVVMVASRGTGYRSKAFRADKLSNGCDCPNIPDHIAAIKQLAQRYPYMDLDRVGVVTQTSSALAAYALLQYPDFFRVGICVNACLDWRLSGAFVEAYYTAGLAPERVNNGELCELAGKLKGKLLIVHGMMDDCIPVAAAFRLIEALQQANKNFDMLLLPNLGHGPSKYVQRRAWDYVLRHLRGEEPPEAFVL